MMAMYRAAELGLKVNTHAGHAYLIPYGKEVQFQLGYRGLIELAYRTGLYTKIEARLVGAGDKFVCRWTPNLEFFHEPADDQDPNAAIKVYAMASIKGQSDPAIEVMTRAEVEKVRASSRSGQSGPWVQWWGEMAKKTVIKRLLKTQRLSDDLCDLTRAIEMDNDDYHGVAEAPRPKGPAGLLSHIQGQQSIDSAPEPEPELNPADPNGLLDDPEDDAFEEGRE